MDTKSKINQIKQEVTALDAAISAALFRDNYALAQLGVRKESVSVRAEVFVGWMELLKHVSESVCQLAEIVEEIEERDM